MKYFIQYLQKDPVAVNEDPLLGISGLIDAFLDSCYPVGQNELRVPVEVYLNKDCSEADLRTENWIPIMNAL